MVSYISVIFIRSVKLSSTKIEKKITVTVLTIEYRHSPIFKQLMKSYVFDPNENAKV